MGIRPSKPVENAYIESFSRRFRDERVNEHWFVSTRHARRLIEEWLTEYSPERPQSSLGYLSPAQFAQAYETQKFHRRSLTAFRARTRGRSIFLVVVVIFDGRVNIGIVVFTTAAILRSSLSLNADSFLNRLY